MSERFVFNALLISLFFFAVATAAVLFFIPAPYGRHARAGWGPTLENRLGWVVMEAPAVVVFAVWTVANLAPRAQSHHTWYHEHLELSATAQSVIARAVVVII
jgi:3-oxo-5-alpha-steroid 4-dehydrogenase